MNFVILGDKVDRDGVILVMRNRKPVSRTVRKVMDGLEDEIAPTLYMERHSTGE